MVNSGIWMAVLAYLLWGFFPIYWKLIKHVPAGQILAHRIIWSFVLLVVFIAVTRQAKSFQEQVAPRRVRLVSLAAAVLIGTNWLIYIWAVNAGFIVETSLGYYINPLVNVILGVFLLKEKLRPWQWLPIGMAAVGVLYLTVSYGSLPWISLALAFSFGMYGLVKKTTSLSSVHGLTMETGLLFLPAVGYLVFTEVNQTGAFLHTGLLSNLVLIGAGIVTITPLLLFSSAVKRIPLSVIGILQYLAPTIQFLLGVFVYNEPFTTAQLVGFSIVWAALAIFTLEGWLARKSRTQAGKTYPTPKESQASSDWKI